MIRIEKKVPIPAAAVGRRRVYPFPEMKIGDSFCLPLSEAKRVRAAAHTHGRIHNVRFVTRTDDKSVRVWRVA